MLWSGLFDKTSLKVDGSSWAGISTMLTIKMNKWVLSATKDKSIVHKEFFLITVSQDGEKNSNVYSVLILHSKTLGFDVFFYCS